MKILILRLSSFGDVVISTAFVEGINIKYPNADIYFLTKIQYLDVFKNNPLIKKTFSCNSSFTEVLKTLRYEKFDIVFDLSSNLRSFFLILFLKLYSFFRLKTIRISKKIILRRLMVVFKLNLNKYSSILYSYSKLLGLEKILYSKIYLENSEINQVKSFIKYDKFKKYIAVNTGAKWNTKKWINSKYIDLITNILNQGINVVLLGDKSDFLFNKKISDNIDSNQFHEGFFFDLTGSLNNRELFSVIKLMNCVVTTDSASLHIAQALDVPVIALFGPTVKGFGFWEPKVFDRLIESNINCRPCSLHGNSICPKKHFNCMNNISVDVVYNEINAILLFEKN